MKSMVLQRELSRLQHIRVRALVMLPSDQQLLSDDNVGISHPSVMQTRTVPRVDKLTPFRVA